MRDVRVVVDAESDDEHDGDARDGVDGQAPAGGRFNSIKNRSRIYPKYCPILGFEVAPVSHVVLNKPLY